MRNCLTIRRRIPRASRHYIDCGPVILAWSTVGCRREQAQPLPDYIYFAVGDLDAVYKRAGELAVFRMKTFMGRRRRDRRATLGRSARLR